MELRNQDKDPDMISPLKLQSERSKSISTTLLEVLMSDKDKFAT